MKIFGFTGFSGSGKTELILQLIRHFSGQGMAVATIKHAHHEFDVDKPGKDSFRYRTVGATQTIISSAKRWAIMHENPADQEADLPFLLRQLQPTDIVLVEGFKASPHPKLEVWRKASGNESLALTDSSITNIMALAVPTDDTSEIVGGEIAAAKIPILPLEDISAIADFVTAHAWGLQEFGS